MEIDEATQGYMDGRDPNSPPPSDNRSTVYRYCWETGRREVEKRHLNASVSRVLAAAAEAADAQRMNSQAMCASCGGTGYVLWLYTARKPRPAHWFSRGPRGERPSECECQQQTKEHKA